MRGACAPPLHHHSPQGTHSNSKARHAEQGVSVSWRRGPRGPNRGIRLEKKRYTTWRKTCDPDSASNPSMIVVCRSCFRWTCTPAIRRSLGPYICKCSPREIRCAFRCLRKLKKHFHLVTPAQCTAQDGRQRRPVAAIRLTLRSAWRRGVISSSCRQKSKISRSGVSHFGTVCRILSSQVLGGRPTLGETIDTSRQR